MLFLNLVIGILLLIFGFATGVFVYWCFEARVGRIKEWRRLQERIRELQKLLKDIYDPDYNIRK